MKEKKTSSVLGISSATFLSRILGLIREQLFAFLLGATNFADAFLVAFRIPNILRDLFAEGALSTAFIPTFTHHIIKKGKKDAFYLSNLVINFLIIIIGLIIIVGYIFTPQIVKLIAPGFTNVGDKFQLTVIMTKILFPFLLLVSISSVLMGILNVHNKFFIPALAPAMFNVTMIFGGIIIIIVKPTDYYKPIYWAIAALIGGFIQIAIQLPAAFKVGYRYKPVIDLRLKNSGLRKVVKLMLPATVGLAAVQINIIINTIIASMLPTGSVAYLNYSFRLIQLPIGMFGVAIATVTTAYITKDVVNKDIKKLKSNIADSLKLNSFLTFPAIVYLFILGDTLVALLFQHGRFNYVDTVNTFKALQFYSLSLFFYSSVKILAPVFYAINKSHKPVISSILSVITNLAVSLTTYRTLGIRGLALGLSAGSFVNFLFLMINFIKIFGVIKKENILSSVLKNLVSSFVMIAVGMFVYGKLINESIFISATAALIASGITYFVISILIKSREMKQIMNIVRRV